MDVLFRKVRPGNLVDEGIAAVTGGIYAHVAVLIPDGRVFSSESPDGVDLTTIVLPDPMWDVVEVDLPWTDALVSWCKFQLGMEYDYVGALSSGEGRGLADLDKWFCSRIVSAVLLRAGMVNIPPLMAPSGRKHRIGLYEWLIANNSSKKE
jgi:hypothetical protein